VCPLVRLQVNLQYNDNGGSVKVSTNIIASKKRKTFKKWRKKWVGTGKVFTDDWEK
jgi:hypothetical protein